MTIPYQRAIQLQQKTDHGTTIKGSELIGALTINPNNNALFTLDIDPLRFEGTRLSQMAKLYQKYRFKRVSIRVMSNLPTVVGGSIICAYSSDPDHDINLSQDVAQQVFALEYAKISNLWVHNVINARILDKKKWYNIDPNSQELMQTTQGRFFLLPSSTISITDAISIPIILEYEIQFEGASLLISSPLTTRFYVPSINLTFVKDYNFGLLSTELMNQKEALAQYEILYKSGLLREFQVEDPFEIDIGNGDSTTITRVTTVSYGEAPPGLLILVVLYSSDLQQSISIGNFPEIPQKQKIPAFTISTALTRSNQKNLVRGLKNMVF